MKRILEYELFKSQRYYTLMEAFTPQGNPRWPSNWKDMDLWKDLEAMGFEDVTTPLQARNATIMLVNKRFPHMYPDGVVLQASGYVRDKAARSGFIKAFKGTDYTLETLLNYVKERWSKEEARMNPGDVGPLSPEQIRYIVGSTKSPWRWNPKTNSVDVDGEVRVYKTPDDDILGTFKFGNVKGAFTLIVESEPLDSLEGFGPDSVKDISIYAGNDMLGGIRSTKGFPTKIKGEANVYGMELEDIEGVPLDIKGLRTSYFDVAPYNIENLLRLLDEGSLRVSYVSGQGQVLGKNSDAKPKDDERSRELALTALSDEALDSYFKKNPLNLYYLDEHPEMKAAVIKRTGIRDLSKTGKNLASKWI